MTVTGYDTTHNSVANIPWDAAVVMGYDTGTPGVRWTSLDWKRFPKARKVHIDQGFTGSPVLSATVRDVEPGAWTPRGAVQDAKGWNPARPTIYCDQADLPGVLAAGWRGDLWLAILTSRPPASPPVISGCTVVAVQYRFGSLFDTSVVFDDFWPERKPTVSGIEFGVPGNLRETATVDLVWDAVPPVDGMAPLGYTVDFYGVNGVLYHHFVTEVPVLHATGLQKGWTFNVHVWANGGNVAPQHASVTVNT